MDSILIFMIEAVSNALESGDFDFLDIMLQMQDFSMYETWSNRELRLKRKVVKEESLFCRMWEDSVPLERARTLLEI